MPKSSKAKRKKAPPAKPPSQQRNDGVQPVSTQGKQLSKDAKGTIDTTVPEQERNQLQLPHETSPSQFQNPVPSTGNETQQLNPSSSNRPKTNAKDLYTTRSKWLKDSQLYSPTLQDDPQYFAPATKTKAPQPLPLSNDQSTQPSKPFKTEGHRSPNSLETVDVHSSDSSTYDIIDAREVERSLFDPEGMVVAKSGLEGESDFEVLSDEDDFDDEYI